MRNAALASVSLLVLLAYFAVAYTPYDATDETDYPVWENGSANETPLGPEIGWEGVEGLAKNDSLGPEKGWEGVTGEKADVEASSSDGFWEGEWSCPFEGLSVGGKWNMTVVNGKVAGEVRAELLKGKVEGFIEGDKLVANASLATILFEEPVKYSWNGSINESDADRMVSTGEESGCKWEGVRKAAGAGGGVKVTYGNISGATSGSEINITYAPKCTENCTKIVFLQMICPRIEFADGTGRYYEHQNDSNAKWNYAVPDEVDGGRICVIDYISGESDPYYNGDDGSDGGAQGKHAGDINATMSDTPRIGAAEIAALEAKYGKNISKLVYEFEVCAFCAQGPDAGIFYKCMAWEHEQVKGGAGSSRAGGSYSPPTAKMKEAADKFGKNHGFPLPKK